MAGRDEPAHDGWASIYFRHCHGKLRQIKPEQLGRSVKSLLPGDRIELFQPIFHRLAEIIAALAERTVALLDEVALLPGQRQRRAMAAGFRIGDHTEKNIVDVAVELGQTGIGADRLFDLAFRGGAIEARQVLLVAQ